jgi:multiple sugar transport system substrate-binding protein
MTTARGGTWALGLIPAFGLAVGVAVGVGRDALAATEVKVGYMKNPIQDASVAILEKWAARHDVRLVKIPMAYSVFQEKVTATLTSGGDQFDIIWHNDDWGQLWAKWLEPTDDVPGMQNIDRWPVEASFYNDEGKLTVVPMAHTVGTFFYRKDLVKEGEVPKTWADLVKVGTRLQQEGKVKWGYVGGMAMNNTWFSFWWTMWGNECDILLPIYERSNKVLAQNGWKPAMNLPCQREVMEYWWDALHTHKISPRAMTTYTRVEANAVFMAGDAAFTLVDSTHYGEFNDPNKSKVVGKVGMAPFPTGPRRPKPVAWNEIWGWAIPKGVPAERKAAAKKVLGAMLTDEEGQIEMWKTTGGPPPNVKLWPKIAAMDPVFGELKRAVFDHAGPMHSAYYFPKWPAVHKAYSDVAIRAMNGRREDIQKVLDEGVNIVHQAAAD